MYKTDPLLVEKCRTLRRKGFTLGEIVRIVKLPKTTIYYQVRGISLPPGAEEGIRIAAIKRINEYIRKYRKGKCMPGREVIKPKDWSPELVFVTAHFMFDGRIDHEGCEYYNRSDFLLQKMREAMLKLFGLQSQIYKRDFGVKQIRYYYVELGDYIKEKSLELLKYIKTSSPEEKKIFLRAFFDDEGCMSYYQKSNKRSVRGYQDDKDTLLLIQTLLQDFGISSTMEKGYTYEVVIRGKENLVRFRDKINFSNGVYINPKRKNSVWKRKLQKRDLLDMAIASYKPLGSPGVHYSKF